MNEVNVIIFYLIVVNGIAYILMGVDKRKAKKQKYRIRERSFWIIAVLGGSIGALLGMKRYRHKTKHRSFTWGMPAVIIIQVILAVYIIF